MSKYNTSNKSLLSNEYIKYEKYHDNGKLKEIYFTCHFHKDGHYKSFMIMVIYSFLHFIKMEY
jgi:hypothetical protein